MLDLSPNYAGTLFGITNTLTGGCIGFLVPVFIGAMTKDNMNFPTWSMIFVIASVIFIISNFLYLFMISGEIQKWNYQVSETNSEAELIL